MNDGFNRIEFYFESLFDFIFYQCTLYCRGVGGRRVKGRRLNCWIQLMFFFSFVMKYLYKLGYTNVYNMYLVFSFFFFFFRKDMTIPMVDYFFDMDYHLRYDNKI